MTKVSVPEEKEVKESSQPKENPAEKKSKTPEGKECLNEIHEALCSFLQDMNSIRQAAVVVMPHVYGWIAEEQNKCQKGLAKFVKSRDGVLVKYGAKGASSAAEMFKLLREFEDLKGTKIPQMLCQSLYTQIFCELDSFMGALLRAIYLKKDELFKSIERQVTMSQLMEYGDLVEVKKYLLLQEIDSFRRDSYVEQFEVLEKKFNLTLKRFPEWGDFVELTQRRNLTTHNGGVVSEQYLQVCKREGYKFEKIPEIGVKLEISPEYLGKALSLVEKVGFMLAHTLWRKIFPEEFSIAHEAANDDIYNLLLRKRWKAAADFGEFSLNESMKKGINDVTLRIRIVNTAIGLKYSNRMERARTLLSSIDLSASYRDFKLAKAVLEDDYAGAVLLMESIGKMGEILDELSYHHWPLFHTFREAPEFHQAYRNIYGYEFSEKLVSEVKDKSNSESSIQTKETDASDGQAEDASSETVENKTRSPRRRKASTESPVEEVKKPRARRSRTEPV